MTSSRIEKNKKQRFDIAKEEHIKQTKNVTKIVIKIFFILLVVFGSLYISCRYIGTMGLVVKEYSLEYDNLPDSFYGLKIIQISDINYNSDTTSMKKIKKLVKKVNSLRPDIIFFTGDLVYGDISQEEYNELEENLSLLYAKLGKYVVFGEDSDDVKILVKNAGFHDIENSYDLIYNDDYSPILIVGIDDDSSNISNSFNYFNDENADNNIFTIAIMHEPDVIDEVLNYHAVDLAMAGHSLNGLIQIPKVGGVFTWNGSKKYFDSYYKINTTDFYISGGVGVKEYPYRLFNHPSINLYRLK